MVSGGEKSPEELRIEKFWGNRVCSMSEEDADRICAAYKEHILGAADYHQMGLVHAGVRKPREDYRGFYKAIRDILKPSDEELAILVRHGFNWAGLIGLLNDAALTPQSQTIIANMIGSMYM